MVGNSGSQRSQHQRQQMEAQRRHREQLRREQEAHRKRVRRQQEQQQEQLRKARERARLVAAAAQEEENVQGDRVPRTAARPVLYLYREGEAMLVAELPSGGGVLGTGAAAEVPVDARGVMDRHLRFDWDGGAVRVEPATPGAQASLNGEELLSSADLVPGDTIVCGTLMIIFDDTSVEVDDVTQERPKKSWFRRSRG
jgi:hypothetical protein